MTTVLEIAGVSVGYGSRRVLREVSVEVRPGEIVALLGANGAGKTTLLRTVTGLLRPWSGTIHAADVEVTRLSAHRIAAAGVLHVPEGRGVFRSLTVLENMRLFSPGQLQPEVLKRVFDHFPQLQTRLQQQAWSLSGGEQQMLALSRALIRPPRLLLVDELSLGLAPVLVQQLGRVLVDLNAAGTSMLLVEENVQFVLSLAHRVYVLRNGEVAFQAAADETRRNQGEILRAYLSAD